MLIESAFLKLPEILLSSYSNDANVEAMLVQSLVTGIQMELNARSVPFAYSHIVVEQPYSLERLSGPSYRTDLLLNAKGCITQSLALEQYGFRELQWLEAKSFFSKGKARPATTQNLGRIIKDLLRLCLLPNELKGQIRQNSRYMLLAFDRPPNNYLALAKRDWARKLLEEINPTVTIDLRREKMALIKSISNCDKLDASITLSLTISRFEPLQMAASPIYWGYLLRIDAFDISIGSLQISSDGSPREYWDDAKFNALLNVRNAFTDLVKGDLPP